MTAIETLPAAVPSSTTVKPDVHICKVCKSAEGHKPFKQACVICGLRHGDVRKLKDGTILQRHGKPITATVIHGYAELSKEGWRVIAHCEDCRRVTVEAAREEGVFIRFYSADDVSFFLAKKAERDRLLQQEQEERKQRAREVLRGSFSFPRRR